MNRRLAKHRGKIAAAIAGTLAYIVGALSPEQVKHILCQVFCLD